MNQAQIHLALNHIPLFLAITGGGILIAGYIKKNESFKSLSLYLLLAAGLSVIPVYLTGGGAEEIAEHLPGVNENSIEQHETMARIALISTIITGALALGALFFKRKAARKYLLFAVILASFASFGIMAKTAHLGGLIRHTELGNTAASTNNDDIEKEGGKENKQNKTEDDDD